MPIKMEQFKSLPKVTPSTRKGGKKIDWDGVKNDMAGKGGYTVAEVHALAVDHALIDVDEKAKPEDVISRFRVSRWLSDKAKKGEMDVRQGDNGYVFAVIGLPPAPK